MSISLKCKYHKDEQIERICASLRWKHDSALCWQCMIDQAPQVKEQKDHIVKIEDFITRISKEFEFVVEQRAKDKPQAKQEHLTLYTEERQQEIFNFVVDHRIYQLSVICNQVVEAFKSEVEKIKETLTSHYEQKRTAFKELHEQIKNTIGLRYGLGPLPTAEEITEKLQSISQEDGDCNLYIRELKDNLLPPVDLERNLQFQEALADFYQQQEISDQIYKENEELTQQQQQQQENQDAEAEPEQLQDSLTSAILKQAQEQCQVLAEELLIGIQYRDPILSRNRTTQSRMRDLNESLNTIFSPEKNGQSRHQRSTVAQRLYDNDSPYKETKEIYPASNKKFAESQVSRKPNKMVVFDQQVKTGQNRSVTSVVSFGNELVATGSRDKSISILSIDQPHDSYQLIGHTDQVTALCAFQSKILVSGGGNLDSTLMVWSLSQRKCLHVMKGHQSGVTSIIDLMDGNSVASGSYDNHAMIWDVHNGAPVCALRKHSAMISSLVLTQRRDHLLTGAWDRTIGVWELSFDKRAIRGAKYVREIKCDSAVLCLSRVGERQVAYGGTGNRVIVIDWHTAEVKRRLNTSQFGIQEILTRGSQLVGLGATDGTLRIWDLNSADSTEKDVIRDPEHIFINNFNSSPKMCEVGDGRLAIVNNSDQIAHFNVYQLFD